MPIYNSFNAHYSPSSKREWFCSYYKLILLLKKKDIQNLQKFIRFDISLCRSSNRIKMAVKHFQKISQLNLDTIIATNLFKMLYLAVSDLGQTSGIKLKI